MTAKHALVAVLAAGVLLAFAAALLHLTLLRNLGVAATILAAVIAITASGGFDLTRISKENTK